MIVIVPPVDDLVTLGCNMSLGPMASDTKSSILPWMIHWLTFIFVQHVEVNKSSFFATSAKHSDQTFVWRFNLQLRPKTRCLGSSVDLIICNEWDSLAQFAHCFALVVAVGFWHVLTILGSRRDRWRIARPSRRAWFRTNCKRHREVSNHWWLLDVACYWLRKHKP